MGLARKDQGPYALSGRTMTVMIGKQKPGQDKSVAERDASMLCITHSILELVWLFKKIKFTRSTEAMGE